MSDFKQIEMMLDSMGRRHPRTLLCELEQDFDRDAAQQVEEGLRALAEQWNHSSLLFPAIRAAIVAESLASDALVAHFKALSTDKAPLPSPAQRATILCQRILAARIDTDKGPIISTLDTRVIELALIGWITQRYNIHIGPITKKKGAILWKEAEIGLDLWDARIKRLASEYEKQTYGSKTT